MAAVQKAHRQNSQAAVNLALPSLFTITTQKLAQPSFRLTAHGVSRRQRPLTRGSIFSPPQQLTSQVTPASCRLASLSMLITRHRRSLVRRQSATIAIRSSALSLMAIPTTPHQPLAAQAPLVMSFRFILMTTPCHWGRQSSMLTATGALPHKLTFLRVAIR